MKEFDFVRDPLQDLASPELWDAILKDCHAGAFDVAVLSPPCNTFSRARWKFCDVLGLGLCGVLTSLKGFRGSVITIVS